MKTLYIHTMDDRVATFNVDAEGPLKRVGRLVFADPVLPPCHGPVVPVTSLKQIRREQAEHIKHRKEFFRLHGMGSYDGEDLSYIRLQIP